MDEDLSEPRCPCGSGMDDSRLCVCLAGSLYRYRLAPRSASFSYALVVLGYGHTSHSLGGPADPRFQAICPTSSGAFPSEPAGDVCVRLSFRGAAFGIDEWNGLLSIRFLVDALGSMFLWNWLVYWLILGAWQAYHYYDQYIAGELRLERLEKSFSEARLNALRMQLDPHFLFNALNTISSQVERDPKLARGMIEHLGGLLRLSLESKDRQEVPLAEEMAFLEHYLAIQKIRFGDHLRIETQIAPEVKYASVPCLFVQPLVENAIRHGISRRASGGTVIVSAHRDGNRLDIRVLDDGVGLPTGWTLENSGGVGLSVTRQRVAELYPDGETCFAVNRRASGGTEVEISLPLRWTGKDAHAAARV